MPLPKEVTFVTFDVYGTLIDWETGIYEAFSKEAERDGYTIDARRAHRALQGDPEGDQGRLLRALRRGPAPHRRADLQAARLAARALALRLPARLGQALAAVQGDQHAARALQEEVRDRADRQRRRQAARARRAATSSRLRPRRHRAAGPLLQARPRALQGVRAPHRRQEGLGPRRRRTTTTTSSRASRPRSPWSGSTATRSSSTPAQKKPTAEVKTLLEAAKLLGAA